MLVIACVDRCDQMLAAVLDPLDRTSRLHGEPCDQHFVRENLTLDAESTADIRRDNANARLWQAKFLGNIGSHQMRHLRG